MIWRITFGVLLVLGAVRCGPGAPSAPNLRVTDGSTIVFLGDSLTYGHRVDRGEDFPSRLARVLPLPVVNAGRSGDTTGRALARFERDVVPHDPAIVVVLLGGNDMLRRVPRETAHGNLEAIIRAILRIGAVPVLIGFDMGLFGKGYGSIIEEVAVASGAVYLEGVVDEVLRDPALKMDPIHPNPEGYRIIAEQLEAPLRELAAAILSRRG